MTRRLLIISVLFCCQGSTIVNDLYGSVNRTGLVVAGAALLGVSGQLSCFRGALFSEISKIENKHYIRNKSIYFYPGYAFLSELNAIPNVDGVAQSVKDLQGFMDGVISRFQVIGRVGLGCVGSSQE